MDVCNSAYRRSASPVMFRLLATVPRGCASATGLLMSFRNEYFLRHINNDRDINSPSNGTCCALTDAGSLPFDKCDSERAVIDCVC